MSGTLTSAIQAAIMATIMQTFGLYSGAAFIALIAALARIAYTSEKASLLLFGRFFIMSLAVTMFLVHLGKWEGWGTDMVVMVSGMAAFMCRELLEFFMASKNVLLKQFAKRLL